MNVNVSLRGLAPLEVVDPAVAGAFMRLGAACGLLGTGLMIWQYGVAADLLHLLAPVLTGVLSVVLLVLQRVRSPRRQAHGLLVVLCVTTVMLAGLAWIHGEGVFAPAIGVMPLVACSAGALLGMRAAWTVAGVGAVCILALVPLSPQIHLTTSVPTLDAGTRAAAVLFQLVCALATADAAGRVLRSLLERARDSESRERELFARSPLALVVEREGRVIMANDSMARLFGFASAQAMEGLDALALHDPAEHARIQERQALSASLQPGARLDLADSLGRRADGSAVRVRAVAARIELSEGPALETVYLACDPMSDAERALLKSDAMLSRLFLSSPVCVMVVDLATDRHLMVNPAFERLTGYSAAEMLGRTSLEMRLWKDPAQRDEFIRSLWAHGAVRDLPITLRIKGGGQRSIRMSGSIFEFEGRHCLLAQAHDVTPLDAERREVAAILDNASVGIAFTVGGNIVRVNQRLEQMLGWAPGALAGQSSRVIWSSDEAHRECKRRMRAMLATQPCIDTLAELYHRNGSALLCHMRGAPLAYGGGAPDGLVWIIEDVTQQHRIARELEQARDAAEAGSRAKSAFLANMSHEIRTPLHGVMGLAELASRHDIGTAQRDRYLAQLIDSGRALTHVISEVLDLSKIEAGQMALEARPFDLHDLAQSVYHLYHPDAQTRGLELDLGVAPDVPQWVQGDAVRVRQILVNFSSNAMKFTPRGSVHLRLGLHQDGRIRLSVRDTGVGLDAATRERLFTPFMQADESTTRRFGGTGLGLSICRQLAHLMGGEVGVSSEPGRGSEFWAALPLPRAAAPAPRPERGLTPSALVALETLQGARVLVVEDHPVNMMIATAQLEQWGVEVLQAGDGVEALELLQRQPRGSIDLVLMDLQMPRMGGEQAVRQLRRSHSAQELPVIALSAAALVEEQQGALAAGFNDFVTKPMDSQRLRRVLMRWLVVHA